MITKKEIEEFLLTIRMLSGIEESYNPVLTKRELDYGFKCNLLYNSKEIKLIIGFTEYFPLHKPSFFLDNIDEFEILPHIDADGYICYTHDENLLIDFTQPTAVISECLNLALKTISDGLENKNPLDYFNEFEAYWRQLNKSKVILSNLESYTSPCKIKIISDNKFSIAFFEQDKRKANIGRFVNMQKVTYNNGIYIPLSEVPQTLKLRYGQKLSSSIIKETIELYTKKEEREEIKKILEDKINKNILLFSFICPNGNRAVFGFELPNIKNLNRYLDVDSILEIDVLPISVQRMEKEFLIARGGNGESFLNKRVLVVGCGSLGGYIVEEIIKCGILNLTVIDNDILSLENCYRHYLGFEYIGKNKATAMKEKIIISFPHVSISSYENRIEALIAKDKINLNDYDAIIIATGNATINLYLNNLIKRHKINIPVFYTWNEAYGIGGHCLSMLPNTNGCYYCLYDDSYNNSFYNKLSFINRKQDKPLLKSISGCGSVYLPYSSLDSRRTAVMCTENLIKYFNNEMLDSEVCSWKGNSKILNHNGYYVSERYKLNQEEINNQAKLFANDNCKICNEENGI